MSEFGTMQICRSFFKHEAFKQERFTQREAFMWMIASAVKRAGPRNVKGHVIDLLRGQFATSQRFMAERFQWTRHEVREFCDHLRDQKMIELSVTESGLTRITVRNYEKWQTVTELNVTESRPDRAQQETSASRGKVNEKDGPPIPETSEFRPATAQISETLTSDSRDSVVDVGVARARESSGTEFRIGKQAFELADEVMQTLGIDLKFIPPPWMGFAMWVQAGLNGGWRPELVRIAAARIRARKNYHIPFSFKYLDRPILREHELAAETPLPIPPVVVSNNREVSRGSPTARSGLAAIDRVFDRLSTVQPRDRQGPDENPVRSLPPRSVSGS